jgi:hypothetical protein
MVENIRLVTVLAGMVVYKVWTTVEAGWVDNIVVTNVLAGCTDVCVIVCGDRVCVAVMKDVEAPWTLV